MFLSVLKPRILGLSSLNMLYELNSLKYQKIAHAAEGDFMELCLGISLLTDPSLFCLVNHSAVPSLQCIPGLDCMLIVLHWAELRKLGNFF